MCSDFCCIWLKCYNKEGDYNITSRSATPHKMAKLESNNWHLAINDYWAWGKAHVHVECEPGMIIYDMQFTYKLYDRYNWHIELQPVELVPGVEITDEFMREFHLQGLAREYDIHGTSPSSFRWIKECRAPWDTGYPADTAKDKYVESCGF